MYAESPETVGTLPELLYGWYTNQDFSSKFKYFLSVEGAYSTFSREFKDLDQTGSQLEIY